MSTRLIPKQSRSIVVDGAIVVIQPLTNGQQLIVAEKTQNIIGDLLDLAPDDKPDAETVKKITSKIGGKVARHIDELLVIVAPYVDEFDGIKRESDAQMADTLQHIASLSTQMQIHLLVLNNAALTSAESKNSDCSSDGQPQPTSATQSNAATHSTQVASKSVSD